MMKRKFEIEILTALLLISLWTGSVWSFEMEDDELLKARIRQVCPSTKLCQCQTEKISCTGFESFAELAFSFERAVVDVLELRPSHKLIINDSLRLNGLKVKKQVILHNVKGFLVNDNPFARIEYEPVLENEPSGRGSIELALFDSTFEFYETNTDILDSRCTRNDLLTTNLFDNTVLKKFTKLSFNGNMIYSKNLCPFVFKNAKIDLVLAYFMNSTNRLDFKTITNVVDIGAKISSFYLFNTDLDQLNEHLLNKIIFNNLRTLYVEGSLAHVESNLFNWFKSLKTIHLELNNFKEFISNERGLSWMSDLNQYENLTALSLRGMHKIILMLYLTDKRHQFTYDDETFCLFKHFPSYRFVYPIIKTKPGLNCSCTLFWLMKNYRSYISQQLLNTLKTESVGECLVMENNLKFQSKADECKLDDRLYACDSAMFTTTVSTAKMLQVSGIMEESKPPGLIGSTTFQQQAATTKTTKSIWFTSTKRDSLLDSPNEDYEDDTKFSGGHNRLNNKTAVRALAVFIATVGFVSISAILGFVLFLYR